MNAAAAARKAYVDYRKGLITRADWSRALMCELKEAHDNRSDS